MRRALAIATLVLAGALAAPASATVISVNTTEDVVNGGDGMCTLREAVMASNSNGRLGSRDGECVEGSSLRDTIRLSSDTYVLSEKTFLPNASQLSISGTPGPLTIAGAGAGSTTIKLGSAVLYDSRLLAVTAPGDHVIQDLTISGGRGGFIGEEGGGAISIDSGTTLTISRCVLTGNHAALAFGGGAIENRGGLTVRDSTFTANTAGAGYVGGSLIGDNGNSGSPGGDGKDAMGLDAPPAPNGGAIESSGDLLVERSVFTGNIAGAGNPGGDGLGGNGGAATSVGAAGGKGGAGQGGRGGRGGSGGAIWASGDTTIVDSTITGNSAGTGGDGGIGRGGNGANGRDGGIGAGGAGGRGGSAIGGAAGEGGGGGGVYIDMDIDANPVVHITGTVINQNSGGRGGSAGTATGGSGGNAGSGAIAGNGGAGGNATGAPGGPGGFGGGIHMPRGTQDSAPDLHNDTVTANTTGQGGAGGQATGGIAGHNTPVSRGSAAAGVLTAGDGGRGGDGGGITYGWLTGAHLTVTANKTGDGGAAGAPNGTAGERGLVGGLYGAGQANVANSIVAYQSRGCLLPLQGSHNISFPDAHCGGTVADPDLQPLADNGGPTLTQRLGPASAARDVVPATGARCEALDQRGRSRPQGQACDAGAYEAAPPVVVTGDATSVTKTTADLSGSVNPNLRATSHHFEYGRTSAYGTSTSSDSTGAGDVAVAAVTSLSGLTPATTYHYRLVASNADGTTTGEDRTFTTPSTGDGSGAKDTTPPAFLSASLSPSKVRKTATLAFRLTEPARVAAVIEARLPGRRVGGKCVRQTRSNARRSRCTRFVTKARSAIAAHAGANSATLSKLTAGHKLPLGRYRLSLRATDAAGNASALKRIQFQVVKRR